MKLQIMKVEIVFKSFQLDMRNGDFNEKDVHEIIANKYNISNEVQKIIFSRTYHIIQKLIKSM